MKCAIMQPTYLPWAGYFNLLSKVDYFVFLDDAQFQKGTWHNRNRLICHKQPVWLTVPVIRKSLNQRICDSLIDDAKSWRRKHIQLIEQNYNNHKFYQQISEILNIILETSITNLSQLNISIIRTIASKLQCSPEFILASELNLSASRSVKLIEICKALDCDHYISPVGAMDYLKEDNFEQICDIRLEFNSFFPKRYPQIGLTEFVDHLSILDVIANIGLNRAKEYVRNEEGILCS